MHIRRRNVQEEWIKNGSVKYYTNLHVLPDKFIRFSPLSLSSNMEIACDVILVPNPECPLYGLLVKDAL